MEMVVHLHSDVFDIVSNGNKDIEVRLYDEKRSKLCIGDTLIFLRRPDEIDSIKARVVDLVRFNNFSEVVDSYDMKRIYLDGYSKEMYLNEMRRFYTEEDELKYGALAIIFEVINNDEA